MDQAELKQQDLLAQKYLDSHFLGYSNPTNVPEDQKIDVPALERYLRDTGGLMRKGWQDILREAGLARGPTDKRQK